MTHGLSTIEGDLVSPNKVGSTLETVSDSKHVDLELEYKDLFFM
jgi:hypothetical protein